MADKQLKRIAVSNGTDNYVLDPILLANEAIQHEIPDATSTNAGKTKLSDATDSDLDALNGKTAATPKAVKKVKEEINATVLEFGEKVVGIETKVGDLNSLTTSAKNSIVSAINEVNAKQSTGGSGGGSNYTPVDATDVLKGVIKLSDTPSTLDAKTGKTAATPKAVKSVETKVGDLGALTTSNKESLVGALNEIKSTGGAPIQAPDANDATKGIVFLSDAIDGTEDARTGKKAVTPKALKTVADLAKTSGANVGDLSQLQTTNKDNIVAAINELKATGGGDIKAPDANLITKGIVKLSDSVSGSEDATTGVTAATPKAVRDVNVKLGDLAGLVTSNKDTLVAAINEAFSKVPDPTDLVGVAYTNKTNTFTEIQKLNKGIAISGGKATAPIPDYASSDDNEIATMKHVRDAATGVVSAYVQAPTLTVEGSPSSVRETPTLTGSSFAVTGGSDTHDVTDWVITNNSGDSIWESLNDKSNKTTIKVPKTKLQVNTDYIAKIRYKGVKLGWSKYTEVPFRTKDKFTYVETPTISIAGGTTDVTPQSVITGSEFKLVE